MSSGELCGAELPLPLFKWYTWAGKRPEIMSGQNFLLSPKDLEVKNGYLRFYVENQGVYTWATLPAGDDPPVFGRFEDHDPWECEEVSLSEHLILMCLFEAIMSHSPFGASTAWLAEDEMGKIVNLIPRISIGKWRWPESTRFYAGGGAFMYASKQAIRGKDGFSVWVGAKTEAPLQFMKSMVDQNWEYVAL